MDNILPFLLLLLLIVPLNSASAQAQPRIRNGTIIKPGSTLSPTNTSSSFWLSQSGHFAFGFYPNGNGFSVGIWLDKIQQKTLVWTANRDDPPFPADAKLLFTTTGSLVVQLNQGQQETIIANAPPSASAASSASMLDSGNFVLLDSTSSIIWQSFDSPTHTILPGQRLLPNQRLVSDVSDTNRSEGKFQLIMQTDGNLVMYSNIQPLKSEMAYWFTATSGAGNNVTLNLDTNGQLYLLNASTGLVVNTIVASNTGASVKPIYRATLDVDGIFRLYSHSLNQSDNWSVEWSSNQNRCDPKGLCGGNSYCILIDDGDPQCLCLPGFDYIDLAHKDSGCHNNYPSASTIDACNAGSVQSLDFSQQLGFSWLDDSYLSLPNTTSDACREQCRADCKCQAAVYDNQLCKMLMLPLRLGRRDSSSQAITFLKTAAAPTVPTVGGKRRHRKLRTDMLITSIALACVTLAYIVTVVIGVLKYRSRVREYKRVLNVGNDGFVEDVTLRSFTYDELKVATNNFVDEIGRGAYGTVFRGVISNGNRIVAIKRLDKVVAEGERDFRNEMKAIGKTHHKNLVQLLGYCYDGTNRLLVYEYMKNGSLADFLFKSNLKLNWEGRIAVALDIARGILYLHEECETQIIHCDIKPENILMDDKGYAKIADFGLAKLLMPSQTKTYTGIRGTRGYVAPEWHRNLPITVKADVYSFGIMLFEIICCRRSVEADVPEHEAVLAHWVYDCYKANEVEELVRHEEVEKCKVERMVKVGLWCTQYEASSRPSMKKVVLMMEGTMNIPDPPLLSSFVSSP